jgi:hypothetical protein
MRRLCLAIAGWTILGFGATIAQTGHIVTDYAQNMSYLPARILAIHFTSANIDASHTMAWADWTVRFAEATPVATPFTGRGRVTSFEIPLQCQNPIAGAKACALEIEETPMEVPYCRIRDGERIDFAIECPKSLELAQ